MRQALIFSAFWFISGAAVGLGIQAFFNVDALVMPCGAANMLMGLVALLFVLRNEKARSAFYGEGEQGSFGLAILIALPFSMLIVGLIWWVMGKLFSP